VSQNGNGIEVGDLVRTAVSLAGIPGGTLALVLETGRRFVAVELLDGRIGYYAPRQLALVPKGLRPAREDVPTGFAGVLLLPGSHACLLGAAEEEARAAVVAFAAAGLLNGEQVVAIAPQRWREELCRALADRGLDAAQALSAGALSLSDVWDYYYQGRDFTAEKQINRLGEWLAYLAARAQGPVRVCGHVGPAVEKADADEWWGYERRVTPLVKALGVLTLCTYPRWSEKPDSSAAVSQRAGAIHTHLLANGHLTCTSRTCSR
jgi:hypothetical protein